MLISIADRISVSFENRRSKIIHLNEKKCSYQLIFCYYYRSLFYQGDLILIYIVQMVDQLFGYLTQLLLICQHDVLQPANHAIINWVNVVNNMYVVHEHSSK